MILDGLLQFDPSGTAITVTAASTNSIDLGVGRDVGAGRISGRIVVFVGTGFTSATATATLTIALQAAPNNAGVAGGWTTILQTQAIPLGQLAATMRAAEFDIPRQMQIPTLPVTTTGTFSNASTAVTVASSTSILNGMFVVGTGIVPGTTVASGAGTTSIVLSANSNAAGTNAALTFQSQPVLPRFLRLNYTCSNTMTAGTVQAYIALDEDDQVFYPPGVTVPV